MNRRLVLGLICLTGLIGCGKGDSKTPGKLPVGFLDAPKPGETVRGVYQVQGWALAESGIKDVSIYLDRNFVATATLGQNRPDLAGTFSSFPNATSGGFVYQWDTSAITAGPHQLTAQARTNDDATYTLGNVSITVAR